MTASEVIENLKLGNSSGVRQVDVTMCATVSLVEAPRVLGIHQRVSVAAVRSFDAQAQGNERDNELR